MRRCVFPQLCPDPCAWGKGEGGEKSGKPEGVRERLVRWVWSLTEVTGLWPERQRQGQQRHCVLESVLEHPLGRVSSGQGSGIPQWGD